MKHTVTFYGQIVDLFGSKKITLELDKTKSTVKDFRKTLESLKTDLKQLNYTVAVNDTIQPDEFEITSSEIHVMPPFAGG